MRFHSRPPLLAALLAAALALTAAGGNAAFPTCGPFTDITGPFCPFVQEIFYLAITTGTTPTTYSPSDNVSRVQMAAFLSRTVDGVLRRGGPQAIANRFWTPQNAVSLGLTTVGGGAHLVECDGTDVWVANNDSATVSRVRASDGRLLETWTGATSSWGPVVAMGRVLVSGSTNPGSLYRIDPGQTAGAVTTVASTLGVFPTGIAFDGGRIWTANAGGSVSIVTPTAAIPWTVTTVAAGFLGPLGVLYDGVNVWVVDSSLARLFRLDANAAVLQTVTLGSNPGFPVFDGTNIWVPNTGSSSISVVRASSGAVLATLTGNGLGSPASAAFDGRRVLVTNLFGPSVSLWKAADLTPVGTFPTGASTVPYGAASDGAAFWITLQGTNLLARF